MNVLICGANGFVGKALCQCLTDAGHRVIRGVRNPVRGDDIAIDFERDIRPGVWEPRLVGIDVVINAVGVLRASRARFERIHVQTPIALFDACQRANITRVIQISALGVYAGSTAYFRSKAVADAHLASLPINGCVVRPSLVYGPDGTSARLFRTLASLPVQCLPGGGQQRLQPIHIDDLTGCVRALAEGRGGDTRLVELAGHRVVTWQEMMATYRKQMQFSPPLLLTVPASAMSLASRLLQFLPGALLTPETWHMLSRHNVAAHNAAPDLLGRAPQRIEAFMPAAVAPAARLQALGAWRPLMWRGALAAIWLLTAWVTAFAYPQHSSLQLLGAVGLTGPTATFALHGATIVDAVLGLATLVKPGRRLWWAQMSLVLTYSLIIAIALPSYLVHPFGPVLKNVAILALLLSLLSEEDSP